MPDKIRQVTSDDLPELEQLFEKRKTADELRWVLQDHHDPGKLNAFVAVNDQDEIIGFVGYEMSEYYYNDTKYQAALSVSWKIANTYKGFAGIQLFKKVLDLGEFGLAIQGSKYGQSLYTGFKLKKIMSAYSFVKVLHPVKYFQSLSGRSLNKQIGNLLIVSPGIFKNRKKSMKNLTVTEIQKKDLTRDIPLNHPGCFEKKITVNYLKWLSSCPLHDNYIFEIKKNNGYLGYCVCYIQKKYKTAPRGRIVYMPYLGEDQDDWGELLGCLTGFFRGKGCCSVGALGSNEPVIKALRSFGFINYKSKQKPVYIRDSKNVLRDVDLLTWYIQYTEGDKTYRNI